jgi:hypothetical protein
MPARSIGVDHYSRTVKRNGDQDRVPEDLSARGIMIVVCQCALGIRCWSRLANKKCSCFQNAIALPSHVTTTESMVLGNVRSCYCILPQMQNAQGLTLFWRLAVSAMLCKTHNPLMTCKSMYYLSSQVCSVPHVASRARPLFHHRRLQTLARPPPPASWNIVTSLLCSHLHHCRRGAPPPRSQCCPCMGGLLPVPVVNYDLLVDVWPCCYD